MMSFNTAKAICKHFGYIIEDAIFSDWEFYPNWFLVFTPTFWRLWIYHGPSSIEFYFGPFSLTKQWEYS